MNVMNKICLAPKVRVSLFLVIGIIIIIGITPHRKGQGGVKGCLQARLCSALCFILSLICYAFFILTLIYLDSFFDNPFISSTNGI